MTAFSRPQQRPSSPRHGVAFPHRRRGSRFPLPTAEIERIAASVIAAAKAGGATAAETDVSQAVGQSVTVRRGEVETVAYNRDKGIGVTVYLGQRRGHASTADFSADAVHAAVGKALAMRASRPKTRRPVSRTRTGSPASSRISTCSTRGS